MEFNFGVLQIINVLCILDVQGYEVENCFWADTGIDAFQQKFPVKKTTISCMEMCVDQNYKYTGTLLSQSLELLCYCGNDIQFDKEANVLDCKFPCPKDLFDKCGWPSRIAVYDVEFETVPILIPVSSETSTAHDQTTETASSLINTAVHENSATQTTPNSRLSTTTENHFIRQDLTTIAESFSSVNEPTTRQSETVSNNDCLCPCESISTKWDFLKNISLSYDKLKALMEDHLKDLERNIAIDKTQTSLYLNKKRSMPDNRTSARTIGFVGVLIILLYVLIIIGSDIANFICSR